MPALEQEPTAYEILGVHPSAPTELISACYWTMTGALQEKRATDPEADVTLHRLTHAYESVADPVNRGGYNLSIGYSDEPLMMRALPRRRFFLVRVFRKSHELGWSVDPHEVLGLHASAPQAHVSVAYRIMNDNYMRLPSGSRRQETLLNLLDDAYAVLEDPQKRAQLGGVRLAVEHDPPARARNGSRVSDSPEPLQPDVAEAKAASPITPPAPARDDQPVSDSPEPLQPDVAEAKVASPITPPAPAERPRPPEAAPSVPDGPPVTAGEGREGGGGAQRVAVAIVASAGAAAGTVARGVRRVVVAVAAISVVVVGGVATAAYWVALAVAALAVAAARFVARSARSGWLAARKWLDRSWEERGSEARGKRIARDEAFLDRLSSTVEKPKIEPPVKRRD